MPVGFPFAPSFRKPLLMTALGDSISSFSSYQPSNLNLTTAGAPAWLASTAYLVGQVVQNGGFPYRCTVAGTSAGSGGPSGTGGSIADNTVTWAYMPPSASKLWRDYVSWVERFSLGRIINDLDLGYKGVLNSLVKVIVVAGGSGYSSNAATDFISFGGNSKMSFNVDSNGKILSCNMINPGQISAPLVGTITTAAGSGATLQGVGVPNGRFAVSGNVLAGMVAYLTDVVASKADIVLFHGGTNDLATSSYAVMIAQYKQIFATIANSGKILVVIPILPRAGVTNAVTNLMRRCNNFIRAYGRYETWANPNKIPILVADCTGVMADQTTNNGPVGGTGANAASVTQDGLHPNSRGAQYMGLTVYNTLQNGGVFGPTFTARPYDQYNGASPSYNPGGNYFEGVTWTASTSYALGDLVANDTAPIKVYRCVQAGTTAASGGPTGTGSSIVDNTARWTYIRAAGMSIGNSGTGGTQTVTAGIAFPGSLMTGAILSRAAGSATGTITNSIETPWSNGIVGVRQKMSFSLGVGDSNEQWLLNILNSSIATLGIQSAQLGVDYFQAEMEIELSNVANMTSIMMQMLDFGVNNAFSSDGAQQGTVNYHMMQSSGEPLSYPNSGRLLLRTQPQLLPLNLASLGIWFYLCFDASGGAASSTVDIYLNNISLHKALAA